MKKYNIKIKNLFFLILIAIIFCLPVEKTLAEDYSCIDIGGTCQVWCSDGYKESRVGSVLCDVDNTFQNTCCVMDTTPVNSGSSDICIDASGIEGICKYGDCTTGTTKLNSDDCSDNLVDTTCCGIVGMNDNPTPLPSSEYDCSDIVNDPKKTPVGICQHDACPAGSVTLAVSECSDNFWDKTCCKFMVSPSATSSLSGLTSNPVNNSNENNNSGSSSGSSTSIVPSQCNSSNTGCVNSYTEALKSQCMAQFTPASCNSMPDYLSALKNKCLQLKPSGIDCDKITENNSYGSNAVAMASYVSGASSAGSTGGLDFDTIAQMGLPDSPGIKVVLVNVMKWMLEIIGLITLIAFIISGGQYLLSAGDETAMQKAKRNMTYSIIGIIVALSGFVIVRAIDTALRATGSMF